MFPDCKWRHWHIWNTVINMRTIKWPFILLLSICKVRRYWQPLFCMTFFKLCCCCIFGFVILYSYNGKRLDTISMCWRYDSVIWLSKPPSLLKVPQALFDSLSFTNKISHIYYLSASLNFCEIVSKKMWWVNLHKMKRLVGWRPCVTF